MRFGKGFIARPDGRTENYVKGCLLFGQSLLPAHGFLVFSKKIIPKHGSDHYIVHNKGRNLKGCPITPRAGMAGRSTSFTMYFVVFVALSYGLDNFDCGPGSSV